MSDNVLNVRLNDVCQGFAGPCASRHPVGKLGVPCEGVATQDLSVLLGKVRDLMYG
jgi:hypothetical protein